MKKHIEYEGSYRKEIEVEFHCETAHCEEEYSYYEDEFDIYENVVCECGAEYTVNGDIDDGCISVIQTKEGYEYDEEEGFIIPDKPAPNQIDLFFNKPYGELKEKGLVS